MVEPFEAPDLADRPDLPSPVLSLAALGDDDLWVGGVGGVGSSREGRRRPQSPLTSVAAMAVAGPFLVAGGSEGIARRPVAEDGGEATDEEAEQAWKTSETGGNAPVSALLAVDDGVLLAATLGDGVLRSTDHGGAWEPSTAGLTAVEVCALAVRRGPAGPEVLAATTEGGFVSADGGRTWRVCAGTEGTCLAAVAYGAAGTPFAVTEDGTVLSPGDDGWRFAGMVRGTATAMTALPDGTLLIATGDTGIWFSRDEGRSWRQADGFADVRSSYCLLAHAGRAYAGTDRGLAASDDGRAWRAIPAPPTHDFTHALDWHERRLVIGRQSGLALETPKGGWEQLSAPTLPLTCVAVTPDDTLLASGPGGLFRYTGDEDGAEEEWEAVVPGTEGVVAQMTFRANGMGLASRPDHGRSLLRTRDHGRTWERIDAPFGDLAPVTLYAREKSVMVQTVEPSTDMLTVWGSKDDGTTWDQVWQGPNKPMMPM